MMQQQTARQTRPLARPSKFSMFLHGFKTLKMIRVLLVDRRIPIVRKVLFVASIGVLLVLLFFPDLLNEVFLSTVLPIIGTVLGVPIDAGFDWVAFALALTALLRFFPADLVAEHYNTVFKQRQEDY